MRKEIKKRKQKRKTEGNKIDGGENEVKKK